MIDVTNDWWNAVIVAGIAGIVGGVLYELLLSRHGDSGMFESFSRIRSEDGSRSYFDVGIIASMVIGGGAAIAFLYFMPPTEVVDEASNVVRREYDPFRLVPGALIVGSAGGAFLLAMQERVKRLISETTNANALAILESAESGTDTGDLVGAGADDAAGRTDIDAAIRVLRRNPPKDD